jgi:hypothetical protein
MRRPVRRGVWAAALVCVGIFAAAFSLAFTGTTSLTADSVRALAPARGDYVPSRRITPGPELVLVFIGSSTCGPSNQPGLPEKVEEIKLLLQARARADSQAFTTIGIARDWDVEAGIGHLRRFGRFDEVIAGRNWINTGLLRYVWEDVPGQAATPQLLVLERRVVDRRTPEAAEGVIRDERLVTRKVGSAEIARWLAQNAPLPRPAAL